MMLESEKTAAALRSAEQQQRAANELEAERLRVRELELTLSAEKTRLEIEVQKQKLQAEQGEREIRARLANAERETMLAQSRAAEERSNRLLEMLITHLTGASPSSMNLRVPGVGGISGSSPDGSRPTLVRPGSE